MNFCTRILITAATAAMYFASAPLANASRIYYLVGVRHVYRIGTDKYAHATERQQIEVDYADEVSADNAHYQYQISHGADNGTESASLQSALGDLASERESRLGALYTQTDEVRNNHPAFNIQVDGPYQVIGVNYHDDANVEVWDSYSAYAPWPGYVSVGPNPYGWNYGASYTPGLFVGAYRGWYGGWVGYGSPAFVGFYGAGGPMVVAGLSVNVGMGFGIGIGFGGFYSNSGLGGYYHRGPGYFGHDPFRGGYISNRGDSRAAMAGRAGYAAGASAVRSARSAGYASGIRAGSRSSFAGTGGQTRAAGANTYGAGTSRSTAARTGGGYAHSALGTASRAGLRNSTRSSVSRANTAQSGYAHSAIATGSRANGGNSARSNVSRASSAQNRNSGSRAPATSARAGYSRGVGGSAPRTGGGNSARNTGSRSNTARSGGSGQSSSRTRSSGGGNRGGGGGARRKG